MLHSTPYGLLEPKTMQGSMVRRRLISYCSSRKKRTLPKRLDMSWTVEWPFSRRSWQFRTPLHIFKYNPLSPFTTFFRVNIGWPIWPIRASIMADQTITPAMAPPAGKVSNFVNPAYAGTKFVVVNCVFLTLAVSSLCIRTWTRLFVVRSFRWDDCMYLVRFSDTNYSNAFV